jgi:hypothetical protein
MDYVMRGGETNNKKKNVIGQRHKECSAKGLQV